MKNINEKKEDIDFFSKPDDTNNKNKLSNLFKDLDSDEPLPPPRNMNQAKKSSLSNLYDSYMSGQSLRNKPSSLIMKSSSFRGSRRSNNSLLIIPGGNDRNKNKQDLSLVKNDFDDVSDADALPMQP